MPARFNTVGLVRQYLPKRSIDARGASAEGNHRRAARKETSRQPLNLLDFLYRAWFHSQPTCCQTSDQRTMRSLPHGHPNWALVPFSRSDAIVDCHRASRKEWRPIRASHGDQTLESTKTKHRKQGIIDPPLLFRGDATNELPQPARIYSSKLLDKHAGFLGIDLDLGTK